MSGTIADADRGNWVDRRAPLFLRPYLRLIRADRPIGGWLLMWPCWWSAALAAIARGEPWPNPWHLLLFLVGAFVMRSAGCIWNDLADRDIDRQVERTRARPLASGAIGPIAAFLLAVLLSFAGLAVLVQFNVFSIVLGIASLAVVAIYPFMKRVTSWPQAVLGIAFSWGALMGWAAAFGSLALAPLLLFAGTVLWVIGYDTVYAAQDKEDDAMVGVKSTARLFGPWTRFFVAVFYLGAVLLFALSFTAVDSGLFAFAGLALFAAHLARQIVQFDPDDGTAALRVFRSNRDAGAILFAGLALEASWRAFF